VIAIASDHIGLELKTVVIKHLDDKGLSYIDYGTHTNERCDYTHYGYLASKAVATGECDKGLIFCGTGVGISILANKVKGIRCVNCSEPYSAMLSRQHNDTNMLALGSRVVGKDFALMIIDKWLSAAFEGGRHSTRVEQIIEVETKRL